MVLHPAMADMVLSSTNVMTTVDPSTIVAPSTAVAVKTPPLKSSAVAGVAADAAAVVAVVSSSSPQADTARMDTAQISTDATRRVLWCIR